MAGIPGSVELQLDAAGNPVELELDAPGARHAEAWRYGGSGRRPER